MDPNNPTTTAPPSDSNSFMRGLAERMGGGNLDSLGIPATAPAQNDAPEPMYQDPDLQRAYEAQQAAAATQAAPVAETAAPAADEVSPTTKQGLDAFSDEPAAAPETPPQPDPLDEPPAGVRTKEAQEAWKRMRLGEKRAIALDKELAELRTKLETAGKLTESDPAVKERDELKKWKAEMEPVIARVAYEKTEAYKNTIGIPMQQIGATAKEIASQYSIEEGKMYDAMTEPDRKRQAEMLEEISTDMNGLDKQELLGLANQLRRLYVQKDQMAEQAAAAYQEALAQETAAKEKSVLERRAAEMRAVVELKPKLTGVAKVLAANGETPEAYVDRLTSEANTVPFDEQEPGQKAYLNMAGLILRDMAPAYKNALAKVASLEKQLAAYAGATPRVNGGTVNPAGGAAPTDFMSAIAQRWQGMNQ